MKQFIILLLIAVMMSCTSRSGQRLKHLEAVKAQLELEQPNYYVVDSVTAIMYEYTRDSTDIKYTLVVDDVIMTKAFTYHRVFEMIATYQEDHVKELTEHLMFTYNDQYLIPFKF